jgi:hypothetical protein
VGSTVEQTPDERVDNLESSAARNDESPIDSQVAVVEAEAVEEIRGDSAPEYSDEVDGYISVRTWHPAVQIAVPVAGFVLAFAFYQGKLRPEERTNIAEKVEPRRSSLGTLI